MVKKIIRIYKAHDADLCWLIEHYKFNFQKAIYCALKGYMNEDAFIIELPEKRKEPVPIRKHYVVRNLVLSEERDADMIAFIEKIPKGYLNCALKNILRSYLMIPVPSAEKSNLAIQKGLRKADAASYPKGWRGSKKAEKKEPEEAGSFSIPVSFYQHEPQRKELSDNKDEKTEIEDLSELFESIISG